MKLRFFRARRGEGKSKWLFERALEAKNKGCRLLYVGTEKTMQGLINIWEAEMHEKCPIELASYDNVPNSAKYCLLTDELMLNISTVGFIYSLLSDKDGTWYITMDQEDFVD